MGIGVKIGIVAFGLLVVGAGYEAYQMRVTPPDVLLAQTAVSRALAKTVVEAFPANARWSSLAIESVTPNAYRFALSYAPGRATPAEIEADARDVAHETILHLSMSGHHPNEERTEIEVTARERAPHEPDVAIGTARFDAAHNRVVFARE